MTREPTPEARAIAHLNDALRMYGRGGSIHATRGVAESPFLSRVLEAVRTYRFEGIDDNNPYGENDFGAVTVGGEKYFFKIDYYDPELRFHSENPADPVLTHRVLTIMRAEEY